MGVQGLQEFIEKHCPSAVVPVELQQLARGGMVGGGRHRAPHGPLRLLLDAEHCLHRLYGGFYTDWVSGGQWNHMLGFLAALARACCCGNIELLVCFNGALEKSRLHEWVKRQVAERQTAQQIVSHVQSRGTPPPKVWFLPPVCMAHCIRLALLRLRVGVVQSVEDHHLEVIALCRENGFHGLVAYDSDYALSNIPHYFSGHALKLSRNGKSLTTSQYLMHQVARQLDLHPNRFVIFASLLGNHILPDEDLAAFHWSLLGPEHPLASLKVRAHQLVLPPCDVVIKAVANYIRNIPDISDLDTITKDIFKHSQSCTEDKILRFKKAVEYYSAASRGPQPPLHLIRPKHARVPAAMPPHASQKTLNIPQAPPAGSPTVEQSHPEPPAELGLSNIPPDGKHKPLYERSTPVTPGGGGGGGGPEPTDGAAVLAASSENEESSATTANHVADVKAEREKNGNPPEGDPQDQTHADLCVTSASSPASQDGLGPQIPSLLSMPTRNHMDVTIPPLPDVAPEVLRVAEHRHRRGLMYPYIYHLLTKGEVKLSVAIEDEVNKDLPSAVQLFRPVRQYVYGVLFSLAEARKKAERLAMRKNCLPDYAHVLVKEWAAHKGKSPHTPELVEALPFREWTCPNLKKLWLGKAAEDKNRRMRAFLACMRSDTPAMLSPSAVPAPLLVLCCVLRSTTWTLEESSWPPCSCAAWTWRCWPTTRAGSPSPGSTAAPGCTLTASCFRANSSGPAARRHSSSTSVTVRLRWPPRWRRCGRASWRVSACPARLTPCSRLRRRLLTACLSTLPAAPSTLRRRCPTQGGAEDFLDSRDSRPRGGSWRSPARWWVSGRGCGAREEEDASPSRWCQWAEPAEDVPEE